MADLWIGGFAETEKYEEKHYQLSFDEAVSEYPGTEEEGWVKGCEGWDAIMDCGFCIYGLRGDSVEGRVRASPEHAGVDLELWETYNGNTETALQASGKRSALRGVRGRMDKA